MSAEAQGVPGDSGPSEAALASGAPAEGAAGAEGGAGLAPAARAVAQGLGGSAAAGATGTGATDTLTQADEGAARRGPAAFIIICRGEGGQGRVSVKSGTGRRGARQRSRLPAGAPDGGAPPPAVGAGRLRARQLPLLLPPALRGPPLRPAHLAHRVLPDVLQLEQGQGLVQKVDSTQLHRAHHVLCGCALSHQHNRRVLKRVDKGAAHRLVGSHHARLHGRGGQKQGRRRG